MKESEIKKYYNKKISELRKHNKLYFDQSSPKISDKEYDEIKREILNLEKKYSYLTSNISPSNSLGFAPSKNFIKSSHRVKMLSLSNAFDLEDLESAKKILGNNFTVYQTNTLILQGDIFVIEKKFKDAKKKYVDALARSENETQRNLINLKISTLTE